MVPHSYRTALADLVKAIEDGMGSLDMWDPAYKAAKAALELPLDGPNDEQVAALLREAIAFGMDIRHKKGCNWASPASNFQKNQQCKCGRDALKSRLNAVAFGRAVDEHSNDATGILQGEKT